MMESPVLIFFLAFLGISIGIKALSNQLPMRSDSFTHEVAEHLRGVLPHGEWKESKTGLRGKVNGLSVSLTKSEGHHETTPGNIVVVTDWSRKIPLGLNLSPDSTVTRLFGREDLSTGDESFDRLVRIEGKPEDVAAVFGADVRARITQFQERGRVEVNLRNVGWSFKPKEIKDGPDLATRIQKLVELAQRLQLPAEEIPARLAENARTDPVPEVRTACFRRLLESHGESGAAQEAALALITSDLPWLRLRAARYLGAPEGIPVLRSLFQDLTLDEELRRESLVALVSLLPRGEVQSLLTKVISHEHPVESLFIAAVQEAGRLGLKEILPSLLEQVVRAQGETLDALAEALAALGDSSAETVLLPKLAEAPSAPTVALVRALGRIGSAASVEPLLRLTKSRRSKKELKAAAHEAIAQIQSRLAGAEAGQLSLSEANGPRGALSTASKTGELTVVETEAEPPQSNDQEEGTPS